MIFKTLLQKYIKKNNTEIDIINLKKLLYKENTIAKLFFKWNSTKVQM